MTIEAVTFRQQAGNSTEIGRGAVQAEYTLLNNPTRQGFTSKGETWTQRRELYIVRDDLVQLHFN